MTQNPSQKFITPTLISLVASGPNDATLRDRAGDRHYELRRVREAGKKKTATYELTVFDEDDIIHKDIYKSADFASAASWAIHEFIRIIDDSNPS